MSVSEVFASGVMAGFVYALVGVGFGFWLGRKLR
jgi:hypothetical protein